MMEETIDHTGFFDARKRYDWHCYEEFMASGNGTPLLVEFVCCQTGRGWILECQTILRGAAWETDRAKVDILIGRKRDAYPTERPPLGTIFRPFPTFNDMPIDTMANRACRPASHTFTH